MVDLLKFILLLVAGFSSVQTAVVMREEEIWPNHVVRHVPEFRAAATVTTVVTTTATDATTITIKKRFDCAKLEAPLATTVCRRKRQYWNVPLFVDPTFVSHDDVQQQFQPVKPTKVIQVAPSRLPHYPNVIAVEPFAAQQPFTSPYSIQSSLDKTSIQPTLRVADPLFGAFYAFSSLLSNIFAGMIRPQTTPAVLITSTKTIYTTTDTVTSTTSTATYTLKGAHCLPPGVLLCPGSSASSVTPGTTSTTTAATSTSTTTAATSTSTTTAATTSTTGTTSAATDSTTTGSTSTTAATTTTTSGTTTDSTTTTSTTEASTTTTAASG
ncbi:hypothetical protein GHT06_011120 [Daphnia sinensis]|uniref:Uncharacterized protein n=1 Tax=Daphnia sinensis TaxID=1820382 RepID=A0AAD5PXI2_9CRUS|nr:hypothetical protein GHT06_011120 [Daphnia sinensis]